MILQLDLQVGRSVSYEVLTQVHGLSTDSRSKGI